MLLNFRETEELENVRVSGEDKSVVFFSAAGLDSQDVVDLQVWELSLEQVGSPGLSSSVVEGY